MLGWGKAGRVRASAATGPARGRDMYQRYASGLYRQAFLTLGDSALAVHVVRDVIADECVLPRRRSSAKTMPVTAWPSRSSGAVSS